MYRVSTHSSRPWLRGTHTKSLGSCCCKLEIPMEVARIDLQMCLEAASLCRSIVPCRPPKRTLHAVAGCSTLQILQYNVESMPSQEGYDAAAFGAFVGVQTQKTFVLNHLPASRFNKGPCRLWTNPFKRAPRFDSRYFSRIPQQPQFLKPSRYQVSSHPNSSQRQICQCVTQSHSHPSDM